MALKRLTIDGYGQIELNNVAFRRDGRIEAQCKPDTTDFASAPLENGMLLAVDNLNRTVKFATDGSLPIALNYSAEHLYDERKQALSDFKLNGSDDFYPRLGYLAVGDKWTENCISYDSAKDTSWTTESAFMSALKNYKTNRLYGGAGTDGSITVSATAPTYGPKLVVIDGNTTMPDGSFGVKFQVLAD